MISEYLNLIRPIYRSEDNDRLFIKGDVRNLPFCYKIVNEAMRCRVYTISNEKGYDYFFRYN
jgi:hypothetical protein